MKPDDPVVQWLLEPDSPSTRYLAMRDLLGLGPRSPRLREARTQVVDDPHVRDLLAGWPQSAGIADGGAPLTAEWRVERSAYAKWAGPHWRLVSLVDLGIPPGHPVCLTMAEVVLAWLTHPTHRKGIRAINGRVRRCGSQEGNALGVCVSLGMAQDPRVKLLADSLVEWQWPDGGWNCDSRPEASHSSFHESVKPLWGLLLYHQATGDEATLDAARRTAELFLSHRLFRSSRSGAVIAEEWTLLHWPAYWHYDILTALDILRLLPGALQDPRAAEAVDLVQEQRLPEGKWRPTGIRHYRLRHPHNRGVEVTDWGRKTQPSKHLTLRALRVLQAAGREVPDS